MEGHNQRTCPNKELPNRIKSKRSKTEETSNEGEEKDKLTTRPLTSGLKKTRQSQPVKRPPTSTSFSSDEKAEIEDEGQQRSPVHNRGRQQKSPSLERSRSSSKRNISLPKRLSDGDMKAESEDLLPRTTHPKPPRFSFQRHDEHEDHEEQKHEDSDSSYNTATEEDQSSPGNNGVVRPKPPRVAAWPVDFDGGSESVESSNSKSKPRTSSLSLRSQEEVKDNEDKKKPPKSSSPRTRLIRRQSRVLDEEEGDMKLSLRARSHQAKGRNGVPKTKDGGSSANGEGDREGDLTIGIARDHTILSSFEALRDQETSKVEESLATLTSFCVLERHDDTTARAPSPISCSQLESNQQKVLLMGGCHGIVKAMSNHPSSFKVQIESARLLTSFTEIPSFPQPTIADSIGSAGAISAVLQALKSKWEATSGDGGSAVDGRRKKMRHAGIQCLRALTLLCPNNVRRLASTKVNILVVLEAMNEASESNNCDTVLHACEVLDNLLASGKWVGDSIVEADGLVSLSKVMTKHRSNKALVQKSQETQEAIIQLM